MRLARPLAVSLIALFAGCVQPPPVAADPAPRVLPTNKPAGFKNVGILIYDDLFITELSGPHDSYHHIPADKRNVFTVAPSMKTIKTYEHIIIQPDFSFENAPRIDILVVPSGNNNLNAAYTGPGKDLDNTELIAFVKTRAADAELVTSHCWGAFILAKAGLLDGKNVTTFPGYEDELKLAFPAVNIVTTARYVEDGKFISSNGGLAAYEAATFVARKVWGATDAAAITTGLVFSADNTKYSSDPLR